jgi:hypothetical protein
VCHGSILGPGRRHGMSRTTRCNYPTPAGMASG